MTEIYRKILDTSASVLLIGLMMALSMSKAYGQTDTNAKIKSLFIYNFTKYVEWPVEMRQGDFVIGILGDYPTLQSELGKMAQTKTRGDQTFKITRYENAGEIGKCHILFVEAEESDHLQEVIDRTAGTNTLIVGDGAGLARLGAGISFYDAQNKQKMEVNPGNVEKHNLKISSQLVALATVVN